MDSVLETIRTALADGATDDVRAAGITACRAVLAALTGATEAPSSTAAANAEQSTDVAQQVGALLSLAKTVPIDQLLDLAIARLKAAMPTSEIAPVHQLKFQLVPIARNRGRS